MYKYAAQNSLRFSSIRGDLTVEQLFHLPLKSQSGFDLDAVARGINTELRAMSEESFVEESSANPRKKGLEIALEIVKDVIKTKQDENASLVLKRDKVEKRRKILDAMNAKKDQKLSEASIEDLEKELAALDA